MNTRIPLSRCALLLSALLFSAGAFASSHTEADHAAHHPAESAESAPAAATAPQMNVMRERMQKIRQTTDPELRHKLMEEQMADMEAMGQGGMGGGMMGGGMMGGSMMGGNMKGGQMMGCPMMQGGAKGSAMHQPEVLQMRIEALEKRVDMLQMMMQMGNGMPMRGGMMGR